MRICVTGAAGFIGSHLAEACLARGDQVTVVDDLSTGRKENWDALAGRAERVLGTIADPAIGARAVERAEVVFHEAAIPSVSRSVEKPLASNEANITGTLVLLDAARAAGVRRVVYAASSSAYGDTPTLPKIETMPASPLSPYAVTKYTGELYCQVYARTFGLETVCLRYFNVFGPRQDPTSHYAAVIPRFVTYAFEGRAPEIFGDGLQSRDFTFIDNVVRANLLAAEAPAAGVSGEVINTACAERVDLLGLWKRVKELTGTKVEPVFQPARPGDVKHSLADISKAERLLGYKPVVSFDEGLRRTVEFFRR